MKTLYIYQEIVDDFWARWGYGLSAKMILDELANIKDTDDLLVRINSPGGFATEAFSIYNALASRQGQTITQNDALAASAAGLIFQAGNPRKTFDNADFMMHESYGGGPGQARDHEKDAQRLRNTNDKMAHLFAKHGKSDQGSYLNMLAEETWLYGKQLLDEGLADEVMDAAADGDDSKAQVRTYMDRDRFEGIFRHAPERVWERAVDVGCLSMPDRINLMRTGMAPTTDPIAQREFHEKLRREFQESHRGAEREATIIEPEKPENSSGFQRLQLEKAKTAALLGK